MDRTFIYSATEAFIYEIFYVYVIEFAKTIPITQELKSNLLPNIKATLLHYLEIPNTCYVVLGNYRTDSMHVLLETKIKQL